MMDKFFKDPSYNGQTFFDEGPVVAYNIVDAVNTTGIDTSDIDAYRQGVNLTQLSHHDAGIVKIHAGEPGHQLQRNGFGMGSDFWIISPGISDPESTFNPALFIENQVLIDEHDEIPRTRFPKMAGNAESIGTSPFDGVIEPFSIRDLVAMWQLGDIKPSHFPRGSVMSGNEDDKGASDQIFTVDSFDHGEITTAFRDSTDLVGSHSLISRYVATYDVINRYSDDVDPHGVATSVYHDAAITNVLAMMTSSTENYIAPGERSATAGFVYDNNVVPGTDSLVFGGRTH